MTKLLTLKHWQIFTLLMGVPVLFQLFVGYAVTTDSVSSLIFIAFPVMLVFLIAVFFGWFYAIGTNLHKKLPGSVTMNLTRFKIFLFIPFAYMISISLIMCNLITERLPIDGQPNPAFFLVIFPLHLFSIFCMFYCLYFNAKALKSVECQREVTSSEYIGEFLMIWFFPFGIWMIQPRLNKLFDPALNGDNT